MKKLRTMLVLVLVVLALGLVACFPTENNTPVVEEVKEGMSFEKAIKLTIGTVHEMKDAKAGTYYFEFTVDTSKGETNYEVWLRDGLTTDVDGLSVGIRGMVAIFDSQKERVAYPGENLIDFNVSASGTYYAVATMIIDGSFNILVQ